MLTKKGTESRRKIIDAAIALIDAKGYDQITMLDICRSAGVATGTFYHYFKSKQDVITAYIHEENEAVLEFYHKLGRTTFSETICKVMHFKLDIYQARGPEFVRQMVAVLMGSSRQTFTENAYAWMQILSESFQEGQRQGEFTSSISAGLLCDITASMFFFFTSLWSSQPEDYSLHELLDAKISAVLEIARGSLPQDQLKDLSTVEQE